MAGEAIKATTDLAKDVTAQVFLALRTPLLQGDRTIRKTSKHGKMVEDHHSYAIPAWFIVGASIAIPLGMWLLGIGLHAADETKPDGTPYKKLVLYDRPRFDPKLF